MPRNRFVMPGGVVGQREDGLGVRRVLRQAPRVGPAPRPTASAPSPRTLVQGPTGDKAPLLSRGPRTESCARCPAERGLGWTDYTRGEAADSYVRPLRARCGPVCGRANISARAE